VTACVPPFADRLELLPSEPVSVTCVELVALTVRVDEPPVAIEAGLAAMVTAGTAAESDCGFSTKPHPTTVSRGGNNKIAARGEETLWTSLCGRIFIARFRSLVDRIESNRGPKQETKSTVTALYRSG
jgi:hypothetical protein